MPDAAAAERPFAGDCMTTKGWTFKVPEEVATFAGDKHTFFRTYRGFKPISLQQADVPAPLCPTDKEIFDSEDLRDTTAEADEDFDYSALALWVGIAAIYVDSETGVPLKT